MRYSLLHALLGLTLLAGPLFRAHSASAQEFTGLRRLPSLELPAQPNVAPAAFAPPLGQPGLAAPARFPGIPASYDTAPVIEPWTNEPPLPAESAFTAGNYGPGIYVQADGLYWHRVGTGCDDVLAINTATGTDLLSTSDLHFNGTGGFRLLAGWTPGGWLGCLDCCAMELSYFGIFGWNADQQLTGAGNLAIPGDLGLASNNFFLADILDMEYHSEIHNVELNCVKSCCICCGTIDFLCGFRYINLTEDFTITGTDFQEGTSSYNVHTDNNLYGLQLGGRYTSQFAGPWSYQLTGKAALFANDVQQSQLATDFPNAGGAFSLRDPIGDEATAVAALGELDFVVIRQLNNTWSLRLGYSAIGLGGLALAPDQLDFTDTATSGSDVHTTGWAFLHGGLAGLEARW